MNNQQQSMWPYSHKAALVAGAVIWVGLGGMFAMLSFNRNWSEGSLRTLLIAVGVAGLLPIVLSVVDNLMQGRAILKIKGFELDFSQAEVRRPFALPDNVGRPEPAIADSSPMQIVSTLRDVTGHDIVRLDLRDGNAWWVTRLLALCAGAVRAGSPKAIVFVGMKENTNGTFVGWAFASALLHALIEDPRGRGPAAVTYGQLYRKAVWLTRQLSDAKAPDIPPSGITLPAAPVPAAPVPPAHPEVQRYLYNPDYPALGDAALEQIVMDLCAQYQLEQPPDRLTLGRLWNQFGHCLVSATLDLQKPQLPQLLTLLEVEMPYVAVVRNGIYEGLLQRDALQSLALRSLLVPKR
jgi:hypothetical protein